MHHFRFDIVIFKVLVLTKIKDKTLTKKLKAHSQA